MTRIQAPVALAARLMLAAIFVLEGWFKIADYDGTLRYMADHGVPGPLLPLAITMELGGGLLVAFGFLSRVSATALAGFCLLTALIFHANFGDADQLIHFYKNIAIAGGFLALAAFGPGNWSVDALRARRMPMRPSPAQAAGQPV